jgi:hypothetical protein
MSLNIEQAKSIPLKNLVEHLGGTYSHTDSKGDLWYFSPFRPEEKTASFKINEKRNTWHDFGLSNTFAHKNQGSGGDTVDLWCDYHFIDRRLGIPQALQGLNSLKQFARRGEELQHRPSLEKTLVTNQEPRYRIIEVKNGIVFDGLKEELNRRRISLELANRYLKQGYIRDTIKGQNYTCFIFENDKGGYEVSIPNPSRNECFKTCIGPKASTRLMASDEENAADVFEGFFDFLSWLEINGYQRHVNHTYILNSVSLVGEVCDKITAFKTTIKDVFLFLDNDKAGQEATTAIAEKLTPEEIKVGSYNTIYKERKDLSEFWAKGPTNDDFKFEA